MSQINLKDLTGYTVEIQLSGNEYVYGKLLDVKSDHLVVLNEDGYIDYYSLRHLVELKKNAKEIPVSLPAFQYVTEQTFSQMLQNLSKTWVCVKHTEGGVIEGVVSEAASNYLVFIEDENIKYVPIEKIVKIQLRPWEDEEDTTDDTNVSESEESTTEDAASNEDNTSEESTSSDNSKNESKNSGDEGDHSKESSETNVAEESSATNDTDHSNNNQGSQTTELKETNPTNSKTTSSEQSNTENSTNGTTENKHSSTSKEEAQSNTTSNHSTNSTNTNKASDSNKSTRIKPDSYIPMRKTKASNPTTQSKSGKTNKRNGVNDYYLMNMKSFGRKKKNKHRR
jgi:hypothetical protein